MRLEDAPRLDDNTDEDTHKCNVEGCDGVYVKYDNDRMCRNCGHMYDETGSQMFQTVQDRWEKFWEDRKNYEGHYGRKRKRCVGSFRNG